MRRFRRIPVLTGGAISLVLAVSPAIADDVFRHGRFEQTFEASSDIANPLAAELEVEFSGPGGARARVLAFWDGGRVWKVRFSPERAGEWRFRAPTVLTPASGSFPVTEYSGDNELYRHGAPRVALNRRHFIHADGKAWFWLSCTGWNSALLSTAVEWRDYIADRAAKKFTAIQFVMTQWRAGRQDERGAVAFTGVDEVRINPEFFRRMDEKFDSLNAQGLVAAPVLLWALTSKDKESPGVALPDQQAALLARYMVARYNAHAVIWILGGDGNYRGANVEKWKTIGRAVFPPGRARHPVTMHPGGMQSPWPEYKDENWLDFLMYQSGHGNNAAKWRWNATDGPALGWKLEPPRPVVDGEPNYEAHLDYHTQKPITDYQVRRAAWYSLLAAPPAGVTYGAHGIWWWGREPQIPLDHARTGVAQPWRECLDYPGARQMKVMRDLLDPIEWWRLRPDRSILAADAVDEAFSNYVMPARTERGDFALIYVPARTTLKLNLRLFRRAVKATWLDPRTGARKPTVTWWVSPAFDAKPPSTDDWLLLLQ